MIGQISIAAEEPPPAAVDALGGLAEALERAIYSGLLVSVDGKPDIYAMLYARALLARIYANKPA